MNFGDMTVEGLLQVAPLQEARLQLIWHAALLDMGWDACHQIQTGMSMSPWSFWMELRILARQTCSLAPFSQPSLAGTAWLVCKGSTSCYVAH